MNTNPTIQIQIAAACYPTSPPGAQPRMVSLASGPKFTPNNLTTHPDLIRRQAQDMLEMFFLQLPQQITNSLPSLPEKITDQPRYLATALQWLALVESGKCQAKCIASEDETTGIRRLVIEMKPEV